LQCAVAFALVTKPTEIIFRVRRNYPREVFRQFDLSCIAERRFQRAQQLSLAAQFRGAVIALLDMRFKARQHSAIQLAVKVSSNLFAGTGVM
jgi:hypothetical protein